MKKLLLTIMVLLTLVLTSATVLASGVVLGPYWYNCDTVASWSSYDFDTCTNDDSTWSTSTTMDIGETMAVGLGAQFTDNPVAVNMRWKEASDTTWHSFYSASVDTMQESYAPFIADTISFSTSGAKVIEVRLTPNGQSTQTYTMTANVQEEVTNDCPTIDDIGDVSVAEGAFVQFDVNAQDDDDSYLYFTMSGDTESDMDFERIDGNSYEFSWLTNYLDEGSYTLTFSVNDDSGLCDPDTEQVIITVGDVNTPPTFDVPNLNTPEDVDPVELNPVGNPVNLIDFATDAEGDFLIYFMVDQSNPGLIDCRVYDNSDYFIINNLFTCDAPAADATGTNHITLSAFDGEFTVEAEFDVVVTPENDAPVMNPVLDQTVCEGALVTVAPTASDVDSSSLTYSISPDGYFTQMGNEFRWQTQVGDEGIYGFTASAQDEWSASDSTTFSIEVVDCSQSTTPTALFDWTPLNPELCDLAVIVTFDGSASFDPEDDALLYSWDFNGDGIEDATGMIVSQAFYTIGDYNVTLTVSDGDDSDSVSHMVTIGDCTANTAPIAEFNWTPEYPLAGEDVDFDASASSDPDGDLLSYSWDMDDDGIIDHTGLYPVYIFPTAGDYPVTLTVSDGDLTDSITHVVHVVAPELNITNLNCFDLIIVGHEQSCSVAVESELGEEGGVHVQLYYEGTDEFIGECFTDTLTGACSLIYDANETGVFTVYATAEKVGYIPDLDQDPAFTYAVVDDIFTIAGLAIYNSPAFTIEDYDFFRGEDMFVSFQVYDEFGNLTNTLETEEVVTELTLVSPPGGSLELEVYHDLDDGWYYYNGTLPLTHDFLGDSHMFVFAFNSELTGGTQRIVAVRIYNNPPEIFPEVTDEFSDAFNGTVTIDLTPYEFDLEDSGEDLVWMASGYDPASFTIDIDPVTDEMTITPVAGGTELVSLRLFDLDGDFDVFEVVVTMNATGNGSTNGTENIPPEAILIVTPESGEAPLLTGVDGSSSYDTDGSIVMYGYDYGDGEDTGMLLGSPLAFTHTYVENGTYNVTLTVIDNDGAVDTDSVLVFVGEDNQTNGSNIPPEAILMVTPESGEAPLDVVIDGTSSFDADGTIVEHEYYSDYGMWLGMQSGTPEAFNYTFAENGTYFVRLTVVDNDGASSTTEVVVIVGDGGNETGDNETDDNETESWYQCNNGIDDDGDGLIDMDDPGCSSPTDLSELNGGGSTQCSDGIDNDGDGYIDLQDPECDSLTDNDESSADPDPETIIEGACNDGIDNDGDGKIDLQDPGCSSTTDNSEDSDLFGHSSWAARPKMSDRLSVNRIDISSAAWQPDVAFAGGDLFIEVALENGFNYDLDDVKLVIWIEGFGDRKSRNVDIDEGELVSVPVNFDVPFDALPGVYDVMVEASSDDIRRVKYREFAVIE